MNWAHSLLKKYNATSHLRLIKQLKAELKPSPKTNKAKNKISNQTVNNLKVPFSDLNMN
tara:strand:- start:286 stop:462 length:177 start_codon:yes stop_codon:yes gene_type:complete